jgi:hypothetical protein
LKSVCRTGTPFWSALLANLNSVVQDEVDEFLMASTAWRRGAGYGGFRHGQTAIIGLLERIITR